MSNANINGTAGHEKKFGILSYFPIFNDSSNPQLKLQQY